MDAMWLALKTLANNKPPATNVEEYFSVPDSSNGARSPAPSRILPASNGHAQGRTPSQWPLWQTKSRKNPLAMHVNNTIPDCLDPWLDTSSNYWPVDEHPYATFTLSACPSRPTTLPSGAVHFHRPLEPPHSAKAEPTR